MAAVGSLRRAATRLPTASLIGDGIEVPLASDMGSDTLRANHANHHSALEQVAPGFRLRYLTVADAKQESISEGIDSHDATRQITPERP
jgi:hypothetical protein